MAMKVILREDVPNVGRSGELVNVKPGFGRNYLLPRKLAVLANEANVKQLEHDRAVISARQAKLRGNAEEQAKRINAVSVTIGRKVGSEGKLFGSVTAADVVEAVEAQTGVVLNRRTLSLDEHIKTVGTHSVPTKLHSDVHKQITVEVSAS